MGYVPAAVPLPTFRVSVELPPAPTDVGLNVAVTPDGWPLALRATFCAVPLVTAVEIVDDPLEPCWTETLVGFALIEKSFGGGAVTVSVTVVLCVATEPVPVTVIVYGPVAVDAPTASVSVALPPVVTDAGVSVAVVPAG
jgi:hypothetical protein